MFEKTSKIPMERIEQAVKNTIEEEANDDRIASPYTKAAPINSNKQFIFSIIAIVIMVILVIIWSINQLQR